MPSFHTIASSLKEKYDQAVLVTEHRVNGHKREFVARSSLMDKPKESDLVYLETSPDFCEPSRKYGSMGTRARKCNIKEEGSGGCKEMCCGRGYVTRRSSVTEKCKCKFEWCCSVKCQMCELEKEEYFCK